MMEYCYLGLQDRIILRHVQLTLFPPLQDARGLMFQGWASTDWGGVVAIKSLSRTVVVFDLCYLQHFL
jgi:hypothetical protein